MTVDRKAITEKVVTALATALVLGIVGYFAGIFEKGQSAINKEEIKAVLEEVLVTDSGKTYAATLAEVNGTLISIDTKVGIIQGDVDKLEVAVRELASE